MEDRYVNVVNIKDVSPQEFKPFGQILGLYNEPPLEDFPHLKYYKDNIDLGPGGEDVTMGLLYSKKKKPGDPIIKMERHKLFTETFIPLYGGEVVFVMAPADNSKDRPDTDRIEAFLLDGRLGISLHKGTWHWPPFPIRDFANIALFQKGDFSGKTDLEDIGFKVFPVL